MLPPSEKYEVILCPSYCLALQTAGTLTLSLVLARSFCCARSSLSKSELEGDVQQRIVKRASEIILKKKKLRFLGFTCQNFDLIMIILTTWDSFNVHPKHGRFLHSARIPMRPSRSNPQPSSQQRNAVTTALPRRSLPGAETKISIAPSFLELMQTQ